MELPIIPNHIELKLLSKAGKKALQLLKQPTPKREYGTPYERPDTPYFIDAVEPLPDSVTIFVSCDLRYGSFYGDSDHWDRSEACVIPAVSFYEMLANLKPGEKASMQVVVDIVKTDITWGIDCEKPHETITHHKAWILLDIEISTDLKTVTLELLHYEHNGFIPYAKLQRSENISRYGIDFILCFMQIVFQGGLGTVLDFVTLANDVR